MTVFIDTVVKNALSQTGGDYTYGGKAPASDPNPKADGHPLDCSGLITWSIERAGGMIPDGSSNQLDYCRMHGTGIPVDVAEKTYGALLFINTPSEKHVVLSLGNGSTIEARGKAYGIGSWSVYRDQWTAAARIPGVYYGSAPAAPAPTKPAQPLLRLTNPYMRGYDIPTVQRVVGVPDDGTYGPQTESAVVNYQKRHGLQPDGIVGPQTRKAMGI